MLQFIKKNKTNFI